MYAVLEAQHISSNTDINIHMQKAKRGHEMTGQMLFSGGLSCSFFLSVMHMSIG